MPFWTFVTCMIHQFIQSCVWEGEIERSVLKTKLAWDVKWQEVKTWIFFHLDFTRLPWMIRMMGLFNMSLLKPLLQPFHNCMEDLGLWGIEPQMGKSSGICPTSLTNWFSRGRRRARHSGWLNFSGLYVTMRIGFLDKTCTANNDGWGTANNVKQTCCWCCFADFLILFFNRVVALAVVALLFLLIEKKVHVIVVDVLTSWTTHIQFTVVHLSGYAVDGMLAGQTYSMWTVLQPGWYFCSSLPYWTSRELQPKMNFCLDGSRIWFGKPVPKLIPLQGGSRCILVIWGSWYFIHLDK